MSVPTQWCPIRLRVEPGQFGGQWEGVVALFNKEKLIADQQGMCVLSPMVEVVGFIPQERLGDFEFFLTGFTLKQLLVGSSDALLEIRFLQKIFGQGFGVELKGWSIEREELL